jgi:DnaJ-domain-containing protein 1
VPTYRLQFIRCGKQTCWCATGKSKPGRQKRATGHGPYWYAFWHEQGKMRSAYVGKERPGHERTEKGERERPRENGGRRKPPPAPPPRRPLENDWQTIGVSPGATWDAVRKAYRAASKKHHPDVGGDPRKMVRLNQAFARIRHAMGK